ncbi:hypothetical protein QR97_01745 [Streptomyces sp. PBH53]|uniref:hypothetical protein n=1 Tax=Streptomyces sp. PBH53 TaxID=1577075 RepID=UPI00065543D0|nr:hypothetical protein [Streptomyces sp. PBH53]AKN68695.1 hypothetical protein QR97_01745 [Streptomyces sp. PBH53]
MSLTLNLHDIETLTASYGALRVVAIDFGPADIAPQDHTVYSLEILTGKTLRQSVINGQHGPILTIRVVEYTDPVTAETRYAVEEWSTIGFRTRDHSVRAVVEVEYERLVREEFSNPSLALDPARFTAGLATFYDVTDVQP